MYDFHVNIKYVATNKYEHGMFVAKGIESCPAGVAVFAAAGLRAGLSAVKRRRS